MNEWLSQLDINSLLIGLLAGLVVAVVIAWFAWRKGISSEAGQAKAEQERLQGLINGQDQELAQARQQIAVEKTRLEEQNRNFKAQITALEKAEERLNAAFDKTAGKVFDARSSQFTKLSEKQLGDLLKPLTQDLKTFKSAVETANKEDIARQGELREKLSQLSELNLLLHTEAQNLTKALTHDVKAQGNWGEQQLERLMEMAGLQKGKHYFTQMSVKGKDGQNLQPDFVMQLPGNTSLILDSKVSLTAWTQYQSAEDDAQREECLTRHVQSIRKQIDSLHKKNYPQAEELNALDFVLMFVPIESAFIAALRQDPLLPEYALQKNVSLLSPANFLATASTVASVWQLHNQNTNARQIAERGGRLYDKFKGFADNLKQLEFRMTQAQDSFSKAYRQLAEGPGNLVSQVEMLKELGVKHSKQMDRNLVAHAIQTDTESSHLRLIESGADEEQDDEGDENEPENTE